MAVYLGLDLSTQSVSAVAIAVEPADPAVAKTRQLAAEVSLPFDEILPAYGTKGGVLPSPDPQIAHSSPTLWTEALDVLFGRLRDTGIDLGSVRAIAGSGQQHGSVYLDAGAADVLAALDPSKPLVEQISGNLTRATSPIWMDSSTTAECEEISDSLGGPKAVAQLTGSQAFERFTGPQIRKFYKNDPERYTETDAIHLVSSYMASLLAGKHAPIDPGDAAGMNLMDIQKLAWSHFAVAATAPGLKGKLPSIARSDSTLGPIAPYFVERYGFSPDARVVAWTGDNPSSLIGVGLVKSGQIAISLGTSDTLFGFMPECRVDPAGEGHVFGSPTGHFMSLICFKNGSFAREKVRDHCGLDWESWSRSLGETPPGNFGKVMLPWFDSEITPNVPEARARLYGLGWDDGPALVRAVVEGQMASMVVHSRWMNVRTETIYATGGASRNRDILQVMANVHNADVYPSAVSNTAALGAALRAWHADFVAAGNPPSWGDIVRGFAEPDDSGKLTPDPGSLERYEAFVDLYEACEDHALRGGSDPIPLQAKFAARF